MKERRGGCRDALSVLVWLRSKIGEQHVNVGNWNQNSPGREQGLPAPLSPEIGLETAGSNALAVIPAASQEALTLPPVLAGSGLPR